MVYLTSFFYSCSNQQTTHVSYDDLREFTGFVDVIAIDFFDNRYDHHSDLIQHLLDKCSQLHVYISEPTSDNNDIDAFKYFLLANDHKNITFYADAVLNFSLTNANYIPVMNWFIDPINYYSQSVWGYHLLRNLTYDFNKPYMFDILLGLEKPHRNLVASLYQNSQVGNKLIFSYYKDKISNGIDWIEEIDTSQHEISNGQIKIKFENARISAVIPRVVYNQSYYSIVCETTCSNQYNQYTEKVAKPIVAKRPFVVFAGQHYLKNLRSLGFKTFDGVIDESYDDIPDLIQRYAAAWQQVEKLCVADPKQVLDQLQPILNHNQKHFLITDWLLEIKKVSYL